MTSKDPNARIAQIVADAAKSTPQPQLRGPDAFEPSPDGFSDALEEGEAPSGFDLDGVDADVVKSCAAYDHSDTDNGKRLRDHFGHDIAITAQELLPTGDWLVWCGTHWDPANGAALVRQIGQKLGDRIGMEAAYLQHTPEEAKRIKRGKAALRKDPDARSEDDRAAIDAKSRAEKALEQRQARRRAFAVTSKNKARMEAALDCAAVHKRYMPDHFNPGRTTFATKTHTLKLTRTSDDEFEDDSSTRYIATLHASVGHDRADWITAIVPCAYDAEAQARRWRSFIEEMLPDTEKRRTVQQFAGLGLLAVPVQKVMFHYGLGANGKSVFLEVLCRLLGSGLAVGLPRESLVGGSERASGSASPDIVRLYGKRLVRITELKADAPVQEDLIKRLTGGEAVPARSLFKGYFEFQNFATPHMSGNGFPTIDGTDNGIWRRMLLVHWDQTMPDERQREFEEFVSEFIREESSGILNWLIEGALDFYANGLYVAPAIRAETASYREEMDPIGEFQTACVRQATTMRVQASVMYEAYVSWSMANAKRVRSQTKFGRVMKQRFAHTTVTGCIYYQDCELVDVPLRPAMPRNPID